MWIGDVLVSGSSKTGINEVVTDLKNRLVAVKLG